MLVITRRPGESVMIGDNVTLTVLEVKGQQVRIGIKAPPNVHILRSELVGRDTQDRNGNE